MSSDQKRSPEISVVFPCVDARGDPEERVRSWTHRQTLSRDRYQVVAVSDGTDPRSDDRISRLLGPQDLLVRHPTRNFLELYDVGLRRAEGRLVVFTEHHCIARSDCLAEVATYFQQNDVAGACLNVEWVCLNELARIKWQERNQERISYFSEADHWNKFVLAGFAVDRDVLLAAGGLEFPYGLFIEVSTGARLHSLGHRLGTIEKAVVRHLDNNKFREVLDFIRNYTEGEIAYLATNDPEYCQRYFGHVPEWLERYGHSAREGRAMSRRVWQALRTRLRSLDDRQCRESIRILAAELVRQHRGRALPIGFRLAAARLAVTAACARFGFWWFNKPRRARALQDACNGMVRHTRLKCAHRHTLKGERPSIRPTADRGRKTAVDPGRLDDACLVGFHASESYQGDPFRWTEPVAVFRLDLPPATLQVTIDTRSLRGAACDGLAACFWNDHEIPHRQWIVGDGRIQFAVARDLFLPDGPQELTLICQPLVPRAVGIADDRRLGLPVFTIEFEETRAVAGRAGISGPIRPRARQDVKAA
jgi:hypothetical protein